MAAHCGASFYLFPHLLSYYCVGWVLSGSVMTFLGKRKLVGIIGRQCSSWTTYYGKCPKVSYIKVSGKMACKQCRPRSDCS